MDYEKNKVMKANEAPEKIYLNWVNYPLEEMQVEYTRTDAFIEKAFKWLEENVERHISADGEYTVYYEEMFEELKKYMKGE